MGKYRTFLDIRDFKSIYRNIRNGCGKVVIEEDALFKYHNPHAKRSECFEQHPYTGFARFDTKVKKYIDRLISEGHYNVYVLMDIMNLKRVNEVEGYKKMVHGDYYMEVVGKVVKRNLREGDYEGFMVGGDEILLLLRIDSKYRDPISIVWERIEKMNEEISSAMALYFTEKNLDVNDIEFGVRASVGYVKDCQKNGSWRCISIASHELSRNSV